MAPPLKIIPCIFPKRCDLARIASTNPIANSAPNLNLENPPPQTHCFLVADIASQLTEDLKAAMRAKDTLALNTLRAVKSAIKNAAIEKGGADVELNESETVSLVRKQIKQRQDSFEQFTSAGRTDLADKEQAEIAILERYLPAALSEDEVKSMVAAAIAETGASSRAEMGVVMKILQEQAAGRVDGKTLSQAVMQGLS